MTDILLQVGLSKLVLSLLVAGIAFLVQRGTRRPELAHGLWLLAIVTLLLPSLVAVPVIDVIGPAAAAPLGVGLDGGNAQAGLVPIAALGSPTGPELILLVWLLGSLGVLVGSIARSLRFHRALGRAVRPAPAAIQSLVASAAPQVGLRDVPRVFLTGARVSPMVWTGWRGTRLLLPEFLLAVMTTEQLRWIVGHELAHLRRGDHMIRWLEWVACVIFWWNPVTWLARRELRAAEERCCDAMVVRSFGADARSYAGSLVSVLECLSTPGTLGAPAHASPAIRARRPSALERRLTSVIASTGRERDPDRVRALLVASAVLIAPLGLGNYAGTAPSHENGFTLDISTLVGTPRERLALAGSALKRAVGDGQVTEAEGRERFLALERRLGVAEGDLVPKVASPQPAYDSVAIRIRGAVEGGKLTPEEGKARLMIYQKRRIEASRGETPRE